jgi:hypothetical protein
MRNENAETKYVRFTVGGNLIQYPDNVSPPTADHDDRHQGLRRQHYGPLRVNANPRQKHSCLRQYKLEAFVYNGHVLDEIRKDV